MNLQTVKSTSDVKLHGVSVEIERRDGSVSVVTLKDGNGGFLRISGQYGISVYVPAPPRTEKRWKLAGTVAGVPVEHIFETKWDAEQAQRDYEGKVRNAEDVSLKVEEAEVVIPD